MGGEWEKVPIGKYAKLEGGFAFKSRDFTDNGVPVAKIKNIKHREIDMSDCNKVDASIAEHAINNFVRHNDILICMTGSGIHAPNSIVGRVAKHRGKDKEFLINQRVGRFIITNEQKLNNNFLYYYLSPKQRQWEFVSIATGSANQVNISGKQIERFKIPLPPLPEQRVIAHILGSLDDKIELNRQMNRALEAMAQAIFKSWFVDFDPVHAKAAGCDIGLPREIADMFPNSFEKSELGEMPKGWKVKTLEDCIEIHDSKRIPLNSRQRAEKQGIFPYYGASGIMDYINEYIFDGIYILLGEDGTVIDKDDHPIIQYVWGRFWVNNHAHVLTGKNGISNEHLYMILKNTNIKPFVTGAVQPKVSQLNLKSIPFVYAQDEINKYFSSWISSLFGLICKNTDESKDLIQIRDTLLPKLISGELRVTDVETFNEDA